MTVSDMIGAVAAGNSRSIGHTVNMTPDLIGLEFAPFRYTDWMSYEPLFDREPA